MSVSAEISTSTQISEEASTPESTPALTQVSSTPALTHVLSTQASSTQASTQAQHLRWTDLMVDTLLDCVLPEVHLGKKAYNSFKKATWEAGVAVVQAVMSEVRRVYVLFDL